MTASIRYPMYVEPLAPSVEEPSVSSWLPRQQSPVFHRRYPGVTGEVRGAEPSLLEEVSRLRWFQPQQLPVSHRRFAGFGAAPSGAEAASLEPEIKTHWFQPQQAPITHRRFKGEAAAVSGIEQAVVEGVFQVYWFQPQQTPTAHRRYGGLTDVAGVSIEANLVIAFDPSTGFPYLPQQDPVAHRRFAGFGVAPSGIDLSILEAVTQVHWFQAQQQPTPHIRYRGLTDFVSVSIEANPVVAFDPSTGFPYSPQQVPIAHRRFAGFAGSPSGLDPSLLEVISQVLWFQPQQSPVVHHRFQGSATGLFVADPTTFVEVVRRLYVQKVRIDDPRLRRFTDLVADIMNSLIRRGILVQTDQGEWNIVPLP